MRKALIEAIAKMTEAEAVELWKAVSQWADNERDHVESLDDPSEAELVTLAAATKIEEAGNARMAELAS